MDPSALVPAPDVIPAPSFVFELLGGVTLLLHLIAMNTVLGGLLVGGWKLFRPRTSSKSPFWKGLPVTLALAINLGVAPLLFLQVNWGTHFFTSSVLMALPWLLVIPTLILAYYALYAVQAGLWQKALVPVVALLMLLIAFVLVNNMTLMLEPGRWAAYERSRDGVFLNLGQPLIWPRWAHFVVASVAVGGLLQAVEEGWRRWRHRAVIRERRNRGLKIFAWATKVQIVVGILQLLVLPAGLRALFLGKDLLLTGLLGLGTALALGAIVTGQLKKLWPTVGLYLATMAVMVGLRQGLRVAFQRGPGHLMNLPVDTQIGPLLLFLLVFVLGGLTVAWMLRTVLRAEREGES
jgi:hypothetical protein